MKRQKDHDQILGIYVAWNPGPKLSPFSLHAYLDMQMQYSFDYCQQVSLPYSSQQCGTFYFKTSHKVQVFGMCCEPLSHQVFFLNQEAEQVADNCVGQNKNTTMLWYLAWRVVTGQHDRIQLHLGLFKKYYCRKDHADNMADLANCVRQCGQNVTCVLQLCKDWQFYYWNAFLDQCFGPLVGFGRYTCICVWQRVLSILKTVPTQ